MALIQIKGIGTIVWGTGNVLAAPTGAIVESVTLTPKNGEPIEIEDNNGLAAIQVMLRDGFNGKVNVMYDSSKTWPIEGVNVAVAISYNGANTNSVPYGEGNGAVYANGVITYTCLVSAPPEKTFNRKKEEMMTLSVTYRPNVNV